jgi:hypothetical protein
MEEKSIFLSLTRGIFTFSNELMTYKLFNQKNTGRWDNDEFNEFDKYLLFGDVLCRMEGV